MDSVPSPRVIDLTKADPFFHNLVVRAVPEMIDLAKDALQRFETVGYLPSEVTPAAVVARCLEEVLPQLSPDVGLAWGAITLQCALLDRLTELTEWEPDIAPTVAPCEPRAAAKSASG
jgi:hypothetical protein